MLTTMRNAIMSIIIFTIITGLVYPLIVTGFAQMIFPAQANGSIINMNGNAVGSALLGQQFDDPRYFWGRPSATMPYPYNGAASSGSNLGPNNPVLDKAIQERASALRAADREEPTMIPIDLVTASGSGLDPHISPAAATYQLRRVAKARGIEEAKVRVLVAANTEDRQFGILGEPRVNILKLNLSLEELGLR